MAMLPEALRLASPLLAASGMPEFVIRLLNDGAALAVVDAASGALGAEVAEHVKLSASVASKNVEVALPPELEAFIPLGKMKLVQ